MSEPSIPFVHLHLHTQYSLLDGANKLPHVIERAHALSQPAIAMTDHGNLHGALEFYSMAKKVGIKPIIGCELYVSGTSRTDRTASTQGGGAFHLTVLARDSEGYRSLCKLVTAASKEGFYFRPRVDHELLKEWSKGLIVLSGCLSSQLSARVKQDDLEGARKVLEFYARTFPDRFYLEIQPHPIPEQQKLNAACIELAKSVGLPLVATTDCHYLLPEDAYAQEVLMCISTGKQISDPDRLKHENVTLFLKTGNEMLREFQGASYAEEAIRNSVAIAASCDLAFDFNTHYMPAFPTDDERPPIVIMATLARAGLEKRLAVIREGRSDFTDADNVVYRDRLEEEIRLIDKMGFAGYFLIVSDFIVWAKEQGIPVGPGRGSAAGSLVAYALRITDIDPIVNKLLFERFLNPERVSLPDIDVDFCIFGRERVIEYVAQKYGRDRVAQIATFGTLKAKAVLKDVGRALGMSYAETDRLAQLVPAPRQGFDFSISEALKMEPRLAAYAEGEGRDLIALAQKLEGLTRHCSTHAAGVVIGDRPLSDLLPLMVDRDGKDVTQYSMNYVEKAGLVKFDFLGLKTLTVIHTAIELVRENTGQVIDLERLALTHSEVYELISAGNTTGIFQLESSGITEMTVRLKPNCFDDLVAILALYRPGPLDAGMVDHYINRKHGRAPITYPHPQMEEVLKDTYGIMIYQEQVMQLARVLAGYTLGEADILRKAMGKKIPEEMAKQRERFVSGAVANGTVRSIANEIFDQIETFGRYGFNRSHTAAYALISYQTAYLKAFHNVEFMAALMTHEMEDSDKTLKNLNECRKQGISVLPPDVNESVANFSVRGTYVRYGLSAVKAVGEKAVEVICAERQKAGPFSDLGDFITRIDLHALNKRVVENLIKCGAFDNTGGTRRDMCERLDDLFRLGQAAQRQADTNQISLFGEADAMPAAPRRSVLLPEWPINKRLAYEKEALGFYISGHPLEKFHSALKGLGVSTTENIRGCSNSNEVRIAGVVTALKLKNTKRGERYASFLLEDAVGTVDALVWPDTYRLCGTALSADEPVVVSGKVDISEERCTLIVSKVDSLISLRDASARAGVLRIGREEVSKPKAEALRQVLMKYEGRCPLRLVLEFTDAEVQMALKRSDREVLCVSPSEALCDEVEQLFGRPVLTFMS